MQLNVKNVFITVGIALITAVVVKRLIARRATRKKIAAAEARFHLRPIYEMSLMEKIRSVVKILLYRLRWGGHHTKALPLDILSSPSTNPLGFDPEKIARLTPIIQPNPKFMSAAQMARMVPDGAVINTGGFGASERSCAFFWAVRERFDAEQHPKDLTWISVSAQGTRGKAPGSIDECAVPGLLKRFIAGHLETTRACLANGAKGTIELYNMPQANMCQCIYDQGHDGPLYHDSLDCALTFIDPTAYTYPCSFITGPTDSNPEAKPGVVGRFYLTPHIPPTLEPLPVRAFHLPGKKHHTLRYQLPKITVAFSNARACDTKGNIYMDENTTTSESFEAAAAAKKNGGWVFVSVQRIMLDDEVAALRKAGLVDDRLVLPAEMVDGICVFCSGAMSDPLGFRSIMLPRSAGKTFENEVAWTAMRFMNKILRIYPTRRELDVVLGQLCANFILTRLITQLPLTSRSALPSTPEDVGGLAVGEKLETKLAAMACINLGVGMPEEVGGILYRRGVLGEKAYLCVESGTVGGLPGMGIFFGAAIGPMKIITQHEMFCFLRRRLDISCLGALEVDQFGNVNVSRKYAAVEGTVGCGGFPNLTSSAKFVVFVFSWFQSRQTNNLRLNENQSELKMLPGKVEAPRSSCTGCHTRKIHTKRSYSTPHKIVFHCSEVTFSGKAALEAGKVVFYCSNVGVFQLVRDTDSMTSGPDAGEMASDCGVHLELVAVVKGLDVQRDIILPLKQSVEVSQQEFKSKTTSLSSSSSAQQPFIITVREPLEIVHPALI